MRYLAVIFSFCLAFGVVTTVSAQKLISPVVPDQLFPPASVVLDGYVKSKLDASYQNRILAQDVNRLIAPFKNRTEDRCWQSEFWGKWFTSAVLAYRYRPEPQLKMLLNQAVLGLIATQSADGYIGNYADQKHLEQWDIWGRKYCMLGLLAWYDLTKDKNSLSAAVKLADHLIREITETKVSIVEKGNHHGMAASSILEPLCLLYARTGDQKYLDFAKEIVRQWETNSGPQLISKAGVDVASRFPKPANWFGADQGQKAYEMMSCYEGLLELYRLTGQQEYLQAVENTWQNILDTEINITGSGSAVECWFGGKKYQTIHVDHYQETCVTATWIKLSQQLLRLTSGAKYGDAIEQTWYNALLGAMFHDGSDWAKYSPLAGRRLHGSEQCGMGLNCCVASGPRGLFTLPLTAVMSSKDGINVNFFVPGSYQLQTPDGKQLEINQKTDYPISGNVTISMKLPKPALLKLRIRIPRWSQQTRLTVNGMPLENVACGEYAEISRLWQKNDEVGLELDMRGRILKSGAYPEQMAILRGPIVLARDARLAPPHVDEIIRPLLNNQGFIDLEPMGTNQNDIWMKYKCSFMIESHQEGAAKPVEIMLCDYASAGNTIDEQSWFRVWLPQSFDPRK